VIHTNSLKALRRMTPATRREAHIISKLSMPRTDREVAEALGFTDMNSVRPFITRLKKDGVVREVGNVRCPVTGRTVRRCQIA